MTDRKNNDSTGDDLLTKICKSLPAAEWDPNVMSILINQIGDACEQRDKAPLVSISEKIEGLLHMVLSGAPQEVKDGILKAGANPMIKTAYVLGQLSFAHQLAATVSLKRPESEFYDQFNDPTALSILKSLTVNGETDVEVAKATGLEIALIKEKIRSMVRLGILDWRSEATSESFRRANFLTPAAEQMMKSLKA